MSQTEKLLRLTLQHEKGFLGHLVQAIPPDQMEPAVKALFEKKKEAVAALEKRVKGS